MTGVLNSLRLGKDQRLAVTTRRVRSWHTRKMANEPSDGYKVDIRAIATTLLQLAPIILVVIYILEYSYTFQFFAQFGVTPEEVGISQIKLLTRAALVTLVYFSIFGILLVLIGLLFAIRMSVQEPSRMRRILRKLNLIEEPKVRNRSITESVRNASKRAQAVRIAGTLSFAVTIAAIILLMNPLGFHLNTSAALLLAAIAVTLTAALFAGWRRNNTRYLVWASGTMFGIVLLGLATFFGGTHNGFYAATTGHIPLFASALGVDILQVHPEWINEEVVPPQYTQDQDLLELGSDTETAFLYDCWTGTTYRIPLDDVVLTYPLYFNKTNPVILRRLRCR
jgi:hypothetical protein